MRLSEAFEAYRSDVILMKNQSRKTEENHRFVQKSLINFLGDSPVELITFEMIREWKLDLDKTRSSSTVRNYVIKLRVVLAYLRLKGETCLHPDLIPVPQRQQTIPAYVSKEDVQKLIDSNNVPRSNPVNNLRNMAMVSLLYASGIRVSELCSMNRDSVKPDGTFTIIGKGGKARLCFTDERTRTLINTYLGLRDDDNKALFTGKFASHRMTPGNVQEVFRSMRRRCGMEGVHPHTMRHSFATQLLQANMNIRYVQALLGHNSLDTTMRYTHVTNPDLKKAYEKHHLI